MKFIFISDFFAGEVQGGCEINNEELAIALRKKGHLVLEKKSSHVIPEFVVDNREHCFIVSNFVHLLEETKDAFAQVRYIIYEHDHKYLKRRNPALFENLKAPEEELINLDFYKSATAVLCQTEFHANVVRSNTGLENVINIGGNLWSETSLKKMEECLHKKKDDKYTVLNSRIPHKGTLEAVRFCELKKWPYKLVFALNNIEFLERFSENKSFVFFPQTPETLSRVVCEARMMGMKVYTNGLVGATKEDWFSLKGKDLIEYMRSKKEDITKLVLEIFEGHGNPL